MDFTTRDALTIIGILGGLVTVYSNLDRRVTRLEAMNHRMSVVEQAVLQLAGKAGASGEALAGVQATVEGLIGRVTSLEGAVEAGIGEVLTLLRTRVPGDRRHGGEA